jgi:hypothetical protein
MHYSKCVCILVNEESYCWLTSRIRNEIQPFLLRGLMLIGASDDAPPACRFLVIASSLHYHFISERFLLKHISQ